MNDAARLANQQQALDTIRRALGRSATVKPAPLEPFIEAPESKAADELLAQFLNEITAVGVQIHPTRIVEEMISSIAQLCAGAENREVALSGSPFLQEIKLAEQLAAQRFTVIETASYGVDDRDTLISRLAHCGAGVTTVDYAIAETGTLVLTSDEENALVVSLLPPLHVAVLRPRQIIGTLAEAVNRLGDERMRRVAPCRSATFITGPSRTSDVELILSVGVHGPKELHLMILSDDEK